MRFVSIIALSWSWLIVFGSLVGAEGSERNPWAELESEIVDRGLDPGSIAIPGQLTDEMREWVRSKVPEAPSQDEAIRSLLWALIDPFGLELEYDPGYTGTAEEVWATRKANCLGFTHLFVGLSRELGLPTYYVKWPRVQEFRKEGDLVLVSEHVSAGIGTGGKRQVLEFGAVEGFEGHLSYPISDLEALARHYSNRSAEQLRAGNPTEAVSTALVATQLEPGLAEGWVNLGVARRRSGDLRGAREAYQAATVANPDHFPAYQNLVVLLQIQGREDAAKEILSLLDRRDNRNPFIYLALGDLSLEAGRLAEADRFYRRATKLGPEVASAKAARGIVALQSGSPKKARKWLKRAQSIDAEDERVAELVEQLSQSSASTE